MYSMAFFFSKTMSTIIVFILCSIVQTSAQISTPCTSSMLKTFTPCLNYVTSSSGTGSSPTQDCCDSLKSVMAQSVECGCLIVTGNVPVSVPFVNRNLAISLPRMCQNSVPIQCKASGDQLPAPGPALFGPTLSPTASKVPAVDAPGPAGGTDIESESPPEILLGPSANPGIRPVVNPRSSSNPTTVSFSYVVQVVYVGIMVNRLFM
ncbi:hypothetical protein CASFOL_010067 [Castilleja foliolosa]|uniref:Bifunctional inhibitor/plant lipid transfer protein/seed storage helical domain-containing protein n=1 Tax=Castilleja foliolosa TaxID=1961234 RepID=A0ABD3DTD1_9LAMI